MTRISTPNILRLALLLGLLACGQAREDIAPAAGDLTPASAGLAGTSWRLVKFQGGDETILTPDDPAKYTISFQPDGRVSARIDCNRGMGTWRSPGPPQLELGPLALTRMMCPEGSLHDQIARQWTYVRSYVIRDGHLFLSLMADGGIYELEPMTQEGTMGGSVRGTATYRERMALPPGAVLEATLEDVSRADALAEVIGRTKVENPGNPPIAFAIPYEPLRIDERRTYAVRARITVDGKPWFHTDQQYPVLTRGKGNQVEVLLRRAPAPSGGTPSLEGTDWKLVRLGEAPIGATQSEPHLRLDRATRRATGSGGCNQMGGEYTLDGDRLTLGRMVSTMMACAEGMETERAFLDALGRVRGWRMAGKELELLDAAGAPLARFEPRQAE